MFSQQKNILITGLPGVGKTTLIIKIAEHIENKKPVGFYTSEIREGGGRKGFRLKSFDEHESILAHVNFRSQYKIGKYGINVNGFEEFIDLIKFDDVSSIITIVDEIGKMECFSEKFRDLLIKLLVSKKLLIATIALRGNEFIEEVKMRNDVQIFHLTTHNRDEVFLKIMKLIGYPII
ncbi:MAG: NTPase [Bacteroidetes bacterium]|nr:NTPase [Bacteroidota bacterium]MBU1423713.1 NTPase [Bacteroidota bacterium]MBU2472017.1 NTPase [Bacteroidota bacterium]MBU2635871.1 NTPase [Bacteroidota bacterium]